MAFQLKSVKHSLVQWVRAMRLLCSASPYGSRPSDAELKAAGNQCAVCYGDFSDAVLLGCKVCLPGQHFQPNSDVEKISGGRLIVSSYSVQGGDIISTEKVDRLQTNLFADFSGRLGKAGEHFFYDLY